MADRRRNQQAGVPAAETTFEDRPIIARADARDDVHYEPDPDQLVRVSHQVTPEALPVEGATNVERHADAGPDAVTDIRVTASSASVHEARPPDD